MSIVNTRGLAAAVLGLLGVLAVAAGPAAAQDGARLARACVQELQQITENHVEQSRDVTRRTVRALRQADEEGAPDRVLRSIAAAGAQRLDAVGEHGRRAVHETAVVCLRRLSEIGASDELIRAVRRAAVESAESIDGATNRGRHVIREALARAIG